MQCVRAAHPSVAGSPRLCALDVLMMLGSSAIEIPKLHREALRPQAQMVWPGMKMTRPLPCRSRLQLHRHSSAHQQRQGGPPLPGTHLERLDQVRANICQCRGFGVLVQLCRPLQHRGVDRSRDEMPPAITIPDHGEDSLEELSRTGRLRNSMDYKNKYIY